MKMGIFDRLFKPNVERLREKKDVKGLIKALRHEDVRKEAAEALVNIGEPAVEPLIQALKDEYSDVREEAARALGRIGDKRAVEPLINALKDEDSDVRMEAAEALDQMGWKPGYVTEKAYYLVAKKEWDEAVKLGEPAVEPLINALKDEASSVRWGAAGALGEIGDERAVEPLINAL
ncbi:MAG: HEAT repeat domain-containing protein, partial [Candidatus Desulfofervidus sp.]|nr:HEAT repeat domain-containing protein [Candidatus Desulfofervidus sp.]